MSPKLKNCDGSQAAARLAIAEQFLEAAEIPHELDPESSKYQGNARVANYAQVGIASADAICCMELKQHSWGDNHTEAINLIKKVKPDGGLLAKHLGTLLGLKTSSTYGSGPMKDNDVLRAERAANHLIQAARDRVS